MENNCKTHVSQGWQDKVTELCSRYQDSQESEKCIIRKLGVNGDWLMKLACSFIKTPEIGYTAYLDSRYIEYVNMFNMKI